MEGPISPLDGRYMKKTEELKKYFNEAAFFKYRYLVEIKYFLKLIDILPELNEARVKHSDVNLRPASEDNLPICFTNAKTTCINGLFRHGWLLAPALLESVFKEIGIKSALSC